MTRTPVLGPPQADPATKPRSSRKLRAPTQAHPPIAHTLFDDYNAWRARCTAIRQRRENDRIRDYKATDERLALMASVAHWCRQRGLDPRLWLYIVFREYRWFWPPKLTGRALMHERHLEAYRTASGLDGYRRAVLGGPTVAQPKVDPNVDVIPDNELRKRRLVNTGAVGECLDRMVDLTFGYHPKSGVCRGCPAAGECIRRLEAWCDFPILALRAGEISVDDAQRIAKERAAEKGAYG